MGWRFRKSVKVAPGVRLNFSKAGVSTTIGGRGASVNIGKRGVYQNLSVPGTGIYRRDKISGSSQVRKKDAGRPSSRKETATKMDDANTASDRVKNAIEEDSPSLAMEGLWRSVALPAYAEDVAKALHSARPQRYEPKTFDQPAPQLEELEERLSREADKQVRPLAFWKAYRMRDAYVKSHIVEAYQREFAEWITRRDTFLHDEAERERVENQAHDEAFHDLQRMLQARLNGEAEYVRSEAQRMVSGFNVPLAGSLASSIQYEGGRLVVDVQLPETCEFPQEEQVRLKSGMVKMKPLSQKRQREDYARYLFCLIAYLAARLFDISPAFDEVVLSGHAIREAKSGERVDEYLISVIVEREELCKAVAERMDAESFCLSCGNRCKATKTKVFKAIEPFAVVA